jgi:hypothetical protein
LFKKLKIKSAEYNANNLPVVFTITFNTPHFAYFNNQKSILLKSGNSQIKRACNNVRNVHLIYLFGTTNHFESSSFGWYVSIYSSALSAFSAEK